MRAFGWGGVRAVKHLGARSPDDVARLLPKALPQGPVGAHDLVLAVNDGNQVRHRLEGAFPLLLRLGDGVQQVLALGGPASQVAGCEEDRETSQQPHYAQAARRGQDTQAFLGQQWGQGKTDGCSTAHVTHRIPLHGMTLETGALRHHGAHQAQVGLLADGGELVELGSALLERFERPSLPGVRRVLLPDRFEAGDAPLHAVMVAVFLHDLAQHVAGVHQREAAAGRRHKVALGHVGKVGVGWRARVHGHIDASVARRPQSERLILVGVGARLQKSDLAHLLVLPTDHAGHQDGNQHRPYHGEREHRPADTCRIRDGVVLRAHQTAFPGPTRGAGLREQR